MAEHSHEWRRIEDEAGFAEMIGPLDCRFDASGTGYFRFFTSSNHLNRGGYAHGGLLMSFADRAMGITARIAEPDRRHATVQLDIHFVAAVNVDSMVEIECKIVSVRRTLTFMQGRFTVEDSLVAFASGVWKNLDIP